MTEGATVGGLLLVRATVHLAGLRAGEHALVNPDDPYVRRLIEGAVLAPAAAAPSDWNCVRCGESDARTRAGGLLCLDCLAAEGEGGRDDED